MEECDWIMGMMNVGLTCCRKRKKKVGAKIRDEERDDVELRSQEKKKKKKKRFGVRDTGFIMIRHPT